MPLGGGLCWGESGRRERLPDRLASVKTPWRAESAGLGASDAALDRGGRSGRPLLGRPPSCYWWTLLRLLGVVTLVLTGRAVCVPLALALPLRVSSQATGDPGNGGDVVPNPVAQPGDRERIAGDASGVQSIVEAGEGIRGA